MQDYQKEKLKKMIKMFLAVFFSFFLVIAISHRLEIVKYVRMVKPINRLLEEANLSWRIEGNIQLPFFLPLNKLGPGGMGSMYFYPLENNKQEKLWIFTINAANIYCLYAVLEDTGGYLSQPMALGRVSQAKAPSVHPAILEAKLDTIRDYRKKRIGIYYE